MSDGDNIDDDGDDVDIWDIFDDPAVEEQLRQNDIQREWELQEQGETFTVTADVHLSSETQHVDVVSTSLQIRFRPLYLAQAEIKTSSSPYLQMK